MDVQPKHVLECAILLMSLGFVASCGGDSLQPESALGQTSDVAQIQATLNVIVSRLDSIEARQEAATADQNAKDADISTQLSGIKSTLANLNVQTGASVGSSVGLQSSLCAKQSFKVGAEAGEKVDLMGRIFGMLGIDGYGNGGEGRLVGDAKSYVDVKPGGEVALEAQVCGQLQTQAGVDASVTPTIDQGSPVVGVLSDLMQSEGPSAMSNAASTLGMSGSTLNRSVTGLGAFSMADLPIGGGGASQVVDALPIPSDIRNAIDNPSTLYAKAGDAAQYAVDQLCGPTLQVGAFQQVMSDGCTLKDKVPSPSQVVDIVTGLDGFTGNLSSLDSSVSALQASVSDLQGSYSSLQGSLASLQSSVSSICGVVGQMVPKSLSIPKRTISILGTTYTTFPGYTSRLFPGLSAPSCP